MADIAITSSLSEEWGISLKFDFRGIRFRMMLAFLALALSVIFLLGALQISLIRPYFRQSKTASIKGIAAGIQEMLLSPDGGKSSDVENAFQQAVESNACVVIYNADNEAVYAADMLGTGCVFNSAVTTDSEFNFHDAVSLRTLVDTNGGEYSITVMNTRTSQEMIVYGIAVHETLADYYMYFNTPLEPADSLITLFSNQYLIYTVGVIFFAVLSAYWFSGRLADPIVRMRKEAARLSDADYDVHFDGGSFSETKDLASALNKAADELEKTDELRRDLMANVSHDIRTPLTNIRAYAEMVRDISGADQEKRTKHLNVIIRETEYLNRLVNEMSELSLMQSGNYVLERSNVDISEKLHEIAEMNDPLIKKSGLELIIEADEHCIIYADDLKIKEVIHNFLTNAIRHSESGGRIWMRAYEAEEGVVRVEVQDEGDGIAEEDLDKIWDRYQKSSRSFTRNTNSTGLGLSIVKAILDAHHAQYGVQSTLGKGSTFWFAFGEYDED